MGTARDFAAARPGGAPATFRDAAARAGVGADRSTSAASGATTTDAVRATSAAATRSGATLADGPVPVTELRAAVIIGSGSASFEMLRHLTEVLPVMVTPRWVRTRCQPIAIRDVLAYLVGVLGPRDAAGRVLEVGGPDVVTYAEMMALYAEVAGLRRRAVIPVPLLTPASPPCGSASSRRCRRAWPGR